jgi:hypothetical protein
MIINNREENILLQSSLYVVSKSLTTKNWQRSRHVTNRTFNSVANCYQVIPRVYKIMAFVSLLIELPSYHETLKYSFHATLTIRTKSETTCEETKSPNVLITV